MIKTPTIRKMKLADLDAASYNPRAIDTVSMKGLRESLQRFGLIDVVVVNVKDGKKTIVSGHQRCAALIAEGFTHADVAVVSFDEVVEKMANVTMNNPAIQGTWDSTKGLPQINAIIPALPKPDTAGFDRLQIELRKDAERAARLAKGTGAEEVTTDRTEKPKSILGTVYGLGKHKLYAGSYDAGFSALLPDNTYANACITALPETDDARVAFVEDALARILKETRGFCYVFVKSAEMGLAAQAWMKGQGILHRWLLWAKDKGLNVKTDYQSQYEIILYGTHLTVKTAADHGKARTNVFEFPAMTDPEVKPTGLIKAIMEDATKEGEVVVDPFAGVGTTVVVAETLGRVCYACEADLHRVDAIRKRWAEQTSGPGANWIKLTGAIRKG